MSSARDGLNFDNILSEIAGDGVDIGKPEVTVPDEVERIASEDEEAKESEVAKVAPKIKEENKATRKRKKNVSRKTKTDRDNGDYSCTKIKKRFISLIRIVYPGMYVHEGVGKVFEEWEKNNQRKIQEAKKNL